MAWIRAYGRPRFPFERAYRETFDYKKQDPEEHANSLVHAHESGGEKVNEVVVITEQIRVLHEHYTQTHESTDGNEKMQRISLEIVKNAKAVLANQPSNEGARQLKHTFKKAAKGHFKGHHIHDGMHDWAKEHHKRRDHHKATQGGKWKHDEDDVDSDNASERDDESQADRNEFDGNEDHAERQHKHRGHSGGKHHDQHEDVDDQHRDGERELRRLLAHESLRLAWLHRSLPRSCAQVL